MQARPSAGRGARVPGRRVAGCVAGARRAATRADAPAGLSLSDAVSKALLRALLDAQEAEGAVAVFRVLHQDAQPTVAQYTDLIACVPAAAPLGSTRTLADGLGCPVVRRRGLIRALRADGRAATAPRVAVDLWEELRGSGLRLDAAAFCAAAGAYAADGQLERARELVGDMQRCGLSPGARMCAPSCTCRCARLD